MTKEQLKARILPRLARKHREVLTWAELVQAVQAGTTGDRDALVSFIADGKPEATGRLMLKLVNALMLVNAEAEADAILADDSLTLAEIERAFE